MRALLGILRVSGVHLALVALGSWSVWAQLVYRTPSRYVVLLLAVTTALSTASTLAFWLHAMFRGVGATDRQLSGAAVGQKICAFVVLGFCFYGLFLFTNGKFDVADPTHHRTRIVAMGMDATELGMGVPFAWADLQSWRHPGDIERIVLRPSERQRLWGGQAVVVAVRPGFYGRRWVSRIEPDLESRSEAILARFPDAGQIRKELAEFHMRLGRFADAAATTREYTRRFPRDKKFPIHMAKLLTSRDRFADVITVLGDVAPRHEDVEVYMLLGYSLGMHGQQAKGIPLLERARAMQPRNWWPHYALGWVYSATGDHRRAVASLERALELRPGLYDVERALDGMRALAARAPKR
jgi:hypothetical protein